MSEVEEDSEPTVAPKKSVAAVKPKPRQSAPTKRKSNAVIDDESDNNDDEAKSGGLRKRSRRSAQKPKMLKDYNENSEESDEDDSADLSNSSEDEDNENDTDFKSPGNKNSRKKNPIKKTLAVSRKNVPRGKRIRQSTDEEEVAVKALSNGYKSNRTSSSRRSRRVDDDNDNLLLLDTVSCYDLLTDLAKHEDVWPFDRPVNKVDVPDYYKVIQQPMDLAKVKSKLNLGEYSSNYDFMNDIQLIFRNCDLYNNSGSPIYT